MSRARLLLLLLATLVSLGAGGEASPEARFHEGSAAYREGDYAAAEQAWREVLDAGVANGHLLYDLGNALYRQGRVGPAVLAWRRARVLLPRDPDVAANLELARAELREQLAPVDHVPAIFFWQRSLALSESALLGALFAGLALGLLAWLRWRRRSQGGAAAEASSLRPLAVLLGVLGALLLLSTALTARALQGSPGAVLVVDEAAGRSAVGADGVELFVLHEGAELRAVEIDAGHVLVALPDGRRGWLTQAAVGLVRPGDSFPE